MCHGLKSKLLVLLMVIPPLMTGILIIADVNPCGIGGWWSSDPVIRKNLKWTSAKLTAISTNDRMGSLGWISFYPPVNEHGNGKWTLNEDVFPKKDGDIPLPCWFTGGYTPRKILRSTGPGPTFPRFLFTDPWSSGGEIFKHKSLRLGG